MVEDACDCPAEQEKGDSDAAEAYRWQQLFDVSNLLGVDGSSSGVRSASSKDLFNVG